MTEALAGRQNLQGDYANYFQWRSENLARYRDRYERFAEILQCKSMEMTKRNFCDHGLDVRLNIINSLRPILQARGKKELLKQNEKALFEFERYIIQETLILFARTDALIALGYESFPGQARGFEAYKKLPD